MEPMLLLDDSKPTGFFFSTPERRQSTRYRIRQGLLVINPGILGPVLDLSLHGMAFEYSGESLSNHEIMTVGLFATENHTLITDLQVRTIWDHISDNTSSFIPIIRKVRAVEFLNLTAPQQKEIQLILSNTAGL